MLCKKVNLIFNQFAKATTAPVGFAFIDLESGAACYKNPDMIMPAASTYKLFLLMGLFYQAQMKAVDLTERLTLEDCDKSVGTGILYSLQSGLQLSVEDLAKMMIAISDNTAADMLFRFLTPEFIQDRMIDGVGLTNTKLRGCSKDIITGIYGRKIDLRESSEEYFLKARITETARGQIDGSEGNCISARDMAEALRTIYAGTLFFGEYRKKMIDTLLLCQTNERLPKELPSSVRVAHKTGSVDRITNDGGIIFTEQGDYILVLLVNGNLADAQEYQANAGRKQTDKMLAQISREVYEVYCMEGKRVE